MFFLNENQTHLNFTHRTIANSINFAGSIDQRCSVLRRAWSTTWMPNRSTLKIHFFTITKRIAALRTASTCWMKMMIISSLEDFSAYITFTISTLDTEGLLIILFTIRLAIFTHVFSTQHCSAHQASKKTGNIKIMLVIKQILSYLKHQICHWRSNAIRAWPSFNSAPQPAQLFGSKSFGLVVFWRVSCSCCWAVALVGLVCCCCVTVFCLTCPPPTQLSHKTSFPVLVTFWKIVCVKKNFN